MQVSQNVTADPTPIAGLTDGATYLLTASGSRRVLVATGDDRPDRASASLSGHERLNATKKAGEDVYCWADRPGSTIVADDGLSV